MCGQSGMYSKPSVGKLLPDYSTAPAGDAGFVCMLDFTITNLRAFCEELDDFPDWSLFQTEHGFFGRGPKFVAVGDRVDAFEGLRTPFLLRKEAGWD